MFLFKKKKKSEQPKPAIKPSAKTKVSGHMYDLSLHDGGVIFYKEGKDIRAVFDLGGCNYNFSSRFFTFLPDYDNNRDGDIVLEVIFKNYSNLKYKCYNSKYHFEPMIMEISDYDYDIVNDHSIKIIGWLDDDSQSYTEVSFDYESTEMQYWLDPNEEYDEPRKHYDPVIVKGDAIK